MTNEAHYSESFHILKTYIDPAVYLVLVVFGLIWNGILLIIFIRHKSIRKPANTMILNLGISDVLNLCLNAPIHYMYHFDQPTDVTPCRLHTTVRIYLRALGAVSILALGLQRYRITRTKITTRTWPAAYVIAVWILSILPALPVAAISSVYMEFCTQYKNGFAARMMVLWLFLFFCVLCPSIMAYFSFITAKKLRKQMPGDLRHELHERRRLKAANTLTALTILFFVTHAPFLFWAMVVHWADVDRRREFMRFSEYISKYLLFGNACFNPIALYFVSSTFRDLFRHYLCCSELKQTEKQSVYAISRFSSTNYGSAVSFSFGNSLE